MPEVRTTNLRFNLGKESQRKAWQYLQTMDKSAFKSYSQAVATAVLDWREAWADAVNRALEEKQQSARVTHLSHAALGLDEQPTVHEGSQARSLELQGIKADRCELNRQIRADNKLLRELKAQLAKLSKVVENTVEHIAETLERLRSSLIMLQYRLLVNRKRADTWKRQVNYYKFIETLNNQKVLPGRLIITNEEAPLTEEQATKHFASIDEQTAAIVADPNDVNKRFARSLDFYLVQDFASAIEDLNQAIIIEGNFFPVYFNRALIRYKQLEYQKMEKEYDLKANPGEKSAVKAADYEMVKRDLDKVIELAPDFVYAYYNRGNVLSILKDYRAAIVDYDRAIQLDPKFADAYFNRGLTHISWVTTGKVYRT